MEQANGVEHLQILLAGTIGMMILFGAIIFFIIHYQKRKIIEQEERRKLMEDNQERVLGAILETQENERRRIARDLHDEVGSTLSIAKMNVGHLLRYVTERNDQETAHDTYTILDDTLKNVRRISKDLHPVILEKYGLAEAVQSIGRKCSSDELEVRILVEDKIERLMHSQELHIFRIVQELLSNALKHAQASVIEMKLGIKKDRLILSYSDNGIGFDPASAGKTPASNIGIGMIAIETRVKMLKGTWKLDSQPGKGTTAVFNFPL